MVKHNMGRGQVITFFKNNFAMMSMCKCKGLVHHLRSQIYIPSPYAGGVQVGSPEPPFKINDIHSMHVVEVIVYTHLLV